MHPLSLEDRIKQHEDCEGHDHGEEFFEIEHDEEVKGDGQARSFGILQNNILRTKVTHGAMKMILKKCQEMGV